MAPNLMKSSDVIGTPLTDQEGRKLGAVREMYLDPAIRSVAFLIVEAASLLGGSGKYHPVPSRIARYDSVVRSRPAAKECGPSQRHARRQLKNVTESTAPENMASYIDGATNELINTTSESTTRSESVPPHPE